MLTMMVGANVTSTQLVSIAERMLLETDLDQVTFVDILHLTILFGLGETCPVAPKICCNLFRKFMTKFSETLDQKRLFPSEVLRKFTQTVGC